MLQNNDQRNQTGPSHDSLPLDSITIHHARQHNLKDLSLSIPRNKLTVITGPSGSGKSSLAFHTLYAEGQRRYVETFSPYVRQFFDRMDKPDVERIDNIPPAIAIEQKNNIRTTRSTVGTLTEINDYLKLLFARAATGYDPETGEIIQADSPDSAADWALKNFAGKPILVTFPIPIPAATESADLFPFLHQQGYLRLLTPEGKILRTDDAPDDNPLPPELTIIDVVQDRITPSSRNRSRLLEAFENAFTYGKGKATIHHLPDKFHHHFTTSWTNPKTGYTLHPPIPPLFTFNSPLGACSKCRGFGRVIGIDLDKALPDTSLSIKQGVILPFHGERGEECLNDLLRICRKRKISTTIPFENLPKKIQEWVKYGDKPGASLEETDAIWESGGWYGIQGFFDWLETKAYKMHVRVFLSRFRTYTTCSTCRGNRLQPAALCYKIADHTLPELWQLPISDLLPLLLKFQKNHPNPHSALKLILHEITSRLSYLDQVGLSYLTLDRPARTLSGGEIERVNLTSCLGAALSNTLFVLDEPTVGLHSRDIQRLIAVMHRLRDNGNTIVVVEHEETVIRAADEIIDLGPASGNNGGHLLYQGSPDTTQKNKTAKLSATLPWLTGEKSILPPKTIRKPGSARLKLTGASQHNIHNLNLDLPLGLFVCLTGVSGSGKSTLAHDILYAHLARHFNKSTSDLKDLEPGKIKKLTGTEFLNDVLIVDQSPLSRTPRSTPALLLGAFDAIRWLFTHTPAAEAQELTPGFFSFNSGDGRCDRCSGSGYEKIEMQFLSDLHVTCPDCHGRRYKPSTLQYQFHGKSIADVLEFTTTQALKFFAEIAKKTKPDATAKRRFRIIQKSLQPLVDVGLGYLTLGQPLNTLSGGESQRLKLCQILKSSPKVTEESAKKSTLLILDEPTTGLHFSDIERLLQVFQKLVDHGHSLLVIEHNLDVIRSADWLLELGPDAGADGGQLIAQGPPKKIAKLDTPTAPFIEIKTPRSRTVKRKKSSTSKKAPASTNAISLRGAREHNLKNISLDIPRDQLVVISGLSGSGKSTLAFDILFAEGQRRFLDSMSTYARQFAEQLEKPAIDQLTGLPPTVAIEQRISQGGRKSTVATVTELWNFIRLLYAKLGTRYCPDCDLPVEQQSIAAIENTIQEHLDRGAVKILAPLVRARKGYYTELAQWAHKQGYSHLLVDGELRETENFTRLTRFQEHDIDLVVWDSAVKLAEEQANPSDLTSALSKALDLGHGTIKLLTANHGPDAPLILSTESTCPGCQRTFDALYPRQFSFNSPHGWCPVCNGYGSVPAHRFRLDTSRHDSVLAAELDADKQFNQMEDDEFILCPDCHGTRLNPDARAVRIITKSPDGSLASISQISRLSVADAAGHFDTLNFIGERQQLIARDILPEITRRLAFLQHVGLGYLQLDRSARTLSGGESQRIRLAAQLGSNLQGVLYVLDEPTIGLHPRDNDRLLDTLTTLRDKGNSLIIVEHDEDTIRRADWLIDLGPGAGTRGGRLTYQGKVTKSAFTKASASKSATLQALTHPLQHPLHARRPIPRKHPHLKLTGCHANNLKNLKLSIPIGRLTVLTGPSGSGKSTLMHECIKPAYQLAHAKKEKDKPAKLKFKSSAGFTKLKYLYEVDQSPIGKTSRSCPATYIKLLDDIRDLFAQLPESRLRGYTRSRFSYNNKEGNCPACKGNGRVRLEMDFLPTTWVPCDTCNGLRYNSATLEIFYHGKNIGQILNMTMEDAADFFRAQPRIADPLKLLTDTGLGYLQLGQPSPTLSGGEAQRIKLVSQLIRGRSTKARLKNLNAKKHNLYLIEEPTVGLHQEDVRRLIDVLHRLVDEGHTVIVIEHHMAIAAEADYLIDLGPTGGDAGGRIIARGTPKQIAASKTSATAPYLKAELER